jgi:tRNA A37 threonylcarbamoyltransferase TsaD
LRRDLARECAAQGFELRLAEPRFCTDNAGMVGVVADYRWRQGQASDAPELEVTPGWSLEEIVA